jgi:hypothetical protein
MSFFLPFEQPLRMSRGEEYSPIASGFWDANTNAPARASTSGTGFLALLPGLAKGKIQTNLPQVFEADPAEGTRLYSFTA